MGIGVLGGLGIAGGLALRTKAGQTAALKGLEFVGKQVGKLRRGRTSPAGGGSGGKGNFRNVDFKGNQGGQGKDLVPRNKQKNELFNPRESQTISGTGQRVLDGPPRNITEAFRTQPGSTRGVIPRGGPQIDRRGAALTAGGAALTGGAVLPFVDQAEESVGTDIGGFLKEVVGAESPATFQELIARDRQPGEPITDGSDIPTGTPREEGVTPLPPATTTDPKTGQVTGRGGFQVPEGQVLQEEFVDPNNPESFGQIFAAPGARERIREQLGTGGGPGSGGGVTTISADEFSGEGFRQRELLRVSDELGARIAHENDPAARAELRDQQLKLFSDFEKGQADRQTAQRFGITEEEARVLRGDFGKQPTQQALPAEGSGRSRFDGGGGGRFVFKGTARGPQVIDSQLGVISAEQAAQVDAQRKAANIKAQEAVQARVKAVTDAEAAAGKAGAAAEQQAFERTLATRKDARATQKAADDAFKQRTDQILLEAGEDPEAQAAARQKIAFARGLRDQGFDNLTQTQQDIITEGLSTAEQAKLKESGILPDFASGGALGLMSYVINKADAPIERVFRALGVTQFNAAPRNAGEAIQQLEAIKKLTDQQGGIGAIETEDLSAGDRTRLEAALSLLPAMQEQRNQILQAQQNRQGVQAR